MYYYCFRNIKYRFVLMFFMNVNCVQNACRARFYTFVSVFFIIKTSILLLNEEYVIFF